MRLSTVLLESFLVLAREQRFSRAARVLHLTQPALTRRIQNLESQVQHQLFVRGPEGLQLTEAGRVLHRYAASTLEHERELSIALGRQPGALLSGFFRIASFSSALRSILVPALGVLLRANPRLSCQAIKAESHDLHRLLLTGRVDYCVSLAECTRMGVENTLLGFERNLLIESAHHQGREDCYIDHEPGDDFTEAFFRCQTGRTMPQMQRAFFDDIYGLIDAVAEGIGRAVVPLHLITSLETVRPVHGFKPLDVPVYLHHHAQQSHTRLRAAVVATLVRECSQRYRAWQDEGGADTERAAPERNA